MAPDLCVGCLGSERCWVCLGPGLLETRPGEVTPCARCAGSGKCFVCQPIPRPIPLARPRRAWHRFVPAQRVAVTDKEAAS